MEISKEYVEMTFHILKVIKMEGNPLLEFMSFI